MKYDNDRLGAALKLYLGTDPLPMHMPGGKRNPDFVSEAFMRDITEIGGFDRRQLVICGANETLEIRPLEHSASSEKRFMHYTEKHIARKAEDHSTLYTHEKSEPFQRYEAMLFAFAEMVRGEKENPYTLDYTMRHTNQLLYYSPYQ